MQIDLNAKRAARAAARGEGTTLQLGDQQFALVDEIPMMIAEQASGGDISGAMRMLLAKPDEDWDRLVAAQPTMDDVMDIISAYGASLGESAASISSSMKTGAPSRQTSSVTTDLTSLPPATAPTR